MAVVITSEMAETAAFVNHGGGSAVEKTVF
jgi:hypothetical protein